MGVPKLPVRVVPHIFNQFALQYEQILGVFTVLQTFGISDKTRTGTYIWRTCFWKPEIWELNFDRKNNDCLGD